MRILVLGASGRTGRLLSADAIARGHSVTAFVRDERRLGALRPAGLDVATGDALDPASLARAVSGQDAVLTLLAPRHERDERVYSRGTANLIAAMDAAGVRRLVAVSAEGVRVAHWELPLAYRVVMLLPGLDDIYEDIGRMEDEVVASDLDWTLVRPAVLTDGPAAGAYRTATTDTVPGGSTISRADLAAFILDVAESGAHSREKVALAD